MFDLFVGTSTGALIAAGLAILQLDPKELIKLYLEVGRELFGEKGLFVVPSLIFHYAAPYPR